MLETDISTLPVNNQAQVSYTQLPILAKVDSILGLQEADKSKNESVILCKRELAELLSKSKGGELKKGVDKIILNLLTNRPEFSKLKLESTDGDFLLGLQNKIKTQSDWYADTREKLDNYLKSDNDLLTTSNPAWFSIKQKKEKLEKTINYKLYATIPISEYNFIQYLPYLAKNLNIFSLYNDDKISLKIPYNLLGFLSHNDSIVIHFKDKKNKDAIESILNKWKKEYSINEEKRNLGRTKFAIDSNETSFSDLISLNIEKWLGENFGKYDEEILVDLAIKYAIEQSQKVPNVNGENI